MAIPKKILVVDDEEIIRELLQTTLERAGYSVHLASSGYDGQKIAKEQSFDLIVTDIRMARGTGIELLEFVRNHSLYDPSVVIMTAFRDFTLGEAYQRGAAGVIEKPFDTANFLEKIENFALSTEAKWQRTVTPQQEIKLSLKSLDSAIDSGVLQLGHGGLFLAGHYQLEEGESMGFHLDFEVGVQSQISGTGWLRWERRDRSQIFQDGVGIEFAHLNPETLAYFSTQRKQDNLSSSFIPIGEVKK